MKQTREKDQRELKTLRQAVKSALEEAYQREVVDTDMEEIEIGKDKEYESKSDWQVSKLDEWVG